MLLLTSVPLAFLLFPAMLCCRPLCRVDFDMWDKRFLANPKKLQLAKAKANVMVDPNSHQPELAAGPKLRVGY